MKYPALVALCFLVAGSRTQAEEAVYSKNEITAKRFNDVWKSFSDVPLRLTFEEATGNVSIYFMDTMFAVALEFDQAAKDTLILRVNKYLAWNDKAIEKQVKLEKLIGNVEFTGWFKTGDDWHRTSLNGAITAVTFFSQNTNTHQMVLVFSKFESASNSIIDHKPDALYFDMQSAKLLVKQLSTEYIQEKLKEIGEQKEIEDEFQ